MCPDAPPATATLSAASTSDALANGAVVRWWQTTAFIEAAGPDAPTLLDGLCTQAVERISEHAAVAGLFLDAKAKVIAPAILHRVPPAAWTDPRSGDIVEDAPRLLLETLPELVEPLRAHVARYRLRARVTVEPADDIATIAIVGDHAERLAATIDTPTDGAWSSISGQGRPTRAFVGPPDACAHLVRDVLPAAALALADPDALEADRIQLGVAGLHDLLPGRMPAEIGGMDAAVALDAGCYLGQEPVARLHYRGHANRTLRVVVADGPIAPAAAEDPEAQLALHRAGAAEGRAVGRLTTWARRTDGATVAFAVLRREVAAGEDLVLAGTTSILRPIDDAAE